MPNSNPLRKVSPCKKFTLFFWVITNSQPFLKTWLYSKPASNPRKNFLSTAPN